MNYKPQNENEIIIKLDGRMANQMFEWALVRSFQMKRNILPLIDDSYETLKLKHFALFKDLKLIKQPILNKILRKIIPFRNLRNKITTLNFEMPSYSEQKQFDPSIFDLNAPCYIKGYFQNEKYFKDIKEQLIQDFKLTKKLNKKNLEMLEKIKNTCSVCVHFRRGDYTKTRVSNFFGICSFEYYKNAVDIIYQKTQTPLTLFVFSDDIKWAKENIKFDFDVVYVDINDARHGYFDLELMKNCKHDIIANSSFSWMAAWLNENPQKIVVAPTPWHKNVDENEDIVPSDWIKLNKE
ncbi:alpha-1,2-fucosyltransferase [bacterium]|nr:alpha-1,2-fucosyltransferase [bacterium]